MADNVSYNQSQLMYGDLEIICGGFKVSYKEDADDLTATNSSTPYGTQHGAVSVEWEASDIDPKLRKPLKRFFDNKIHETLASYDFDENTGDLFEDDVLYNAYITEISKEDGNKPFSVKGGARGYKKQN